MHNQLARNANAAYILRVQVLSYFAELSFNTLFSSVIGLDEACKVEALAF